MSEEGKKMTIDDLAIIIKETIADKMVTKDEFEVVKQDVSVLKQDVSVLKQDVSFLKQDFVDIQSDLRSFRQEVEEEFSHVNSKLDGLADTVRIQDKRIEVLEDKVLI